MAGSFRGDSGMNGYLAKHNFRYNAPRGHDQCVDCGEVFDHLKFWAAGRAKMPVEPRQLIMELK